MKEILKRTLQEKFSDDDSVDLAGFMDDEHDNGFDLGGFMNKHANGFDMRRILVLPKFTEEFSTNSLSVFDVTGVAVVVGPCTHSVSKFIQVQDGDWKKKSDVDMGPFCTISHVTLLLSKATRTRPGGNKNARSPAQSPTQGQGKDASSSLGEDSGESGADETPAGEPQEEEGAAPPKKKRRRRNQITKKRKGKTKRPQKKKNTGSAKQGTSCNPLQKT